jgi:hypothetical protein
MSRGMFLGFLGKIGVLTLVTSIPVFGAESKLRLRATTESKTTKPVFRRMRYTDILRSPTIKGKQLSGKVLEGKLSTKNLENLRDVLTGRFFGRAAEEALKDGYAPLINWKLGSAGDDSGCFLYACQNLAPQDVYCPPVIASPICTFQMASFEEKGKLVINVISSLIASSGILGSGALENGYCGDYCGGECVDHGDCSVECGTYCHPQSNLDPGEIVSYPGDKFASELLSILGTTDVGVIQKELKDVIFSDQVLNLGLQHIALAANNGIAEGVESGQFA